MATRAPPLAGGKGNGLLPQRNPGPEPAQELEEGEGEEDPVAQAVAAARGAVGGRRRVVVGGGGYRRGGPVGEEGEAAEDDDARRGLRGPVVDQPDLLGHGQGDEVGEPDEEEDRGEEGGRRGRGREVLRLRLWVGGTWVRVSWGLTELVAGGERRLRMRDVPFPWPRPAHTPEPGRR